MTISKQVIGAEFDRALSGMLAKQDTTLDKLYADIAKADGKQGVPDFFAPPELKALRQEAAALGQPNTDSYSNLAKQQFGVLRQEFINAVATASSEQYAGKSGEGFNTAFSARVTELLNGNAQAQAALNFANGLGKVKAIADKAPAPEQFTFANITANPEFRSWVASNESAINAPSAPQTNTAVAKAEDQPEAPAPASAPQAKPATPKPAPAVAQQPPASAPQTPKTSNASLTVTNLGGDTENPTVVAQPASNNAASSSSNNASSNSDSNSGNKPDVMPKEEKVHKYARAIAENPKEAEVLEKIFQRTLVEGKTGSPSFEREREGWMSQAAMWWRNGGPHGMMQTIQHFIMGIFNWITGNGDAGDILASVEIGNSRSNMQALKDTLRMSGPGDLDPRIETATGAVISGEDLIRISRTNGAVNKAEQQYERAERSGKGVREAKAEYEEAREAQDRLNAVNERKFGMNNRGMWDKWEAYKADLTERAMEQGANYVDGGDPHGKPAIETQLASNDKKTNASVSPEVLVQANRAANTESSVSGGEHQNMPDAPTHHHAAGHNHDHSHSHAVG